MVTHHHPRKMLLGGIPGSRVRNELHINFYVLQWVRTTMDSPKFGRRVEHTTVPCMATTTEQHGIILTHVMHSSSCHLNQAMCFLASTSCGILVLTRKASRRVSSRCYTRCAFRRLFRQNIHFYTSCAPHSAVESIACTSLQRVFTSLTRAQCTVVLLSWSSLRFVQAQELVDGEIHS